MLLRLIFLCLFSSTLGCSPLVNPDYPEYKIHQQINTAKQIAESAKNYLANVQTNFDRKQAEVKKGEAEIAKEQNDIDLARDYHETVAKIEAKTRRKRETLKELEARKQSLASKISDKTLLIKRQFEAAEKALEEKKKEQKKIEAELEELRKKVEEAKKKKEEAEKAVMVAEQDLEDIREETKLEGDMAKFYKNVKLVEERAKVEAKEKEDRWRNGFDKDIDKVEQLEKQVLASTDSIVKQKFSLLKEQFDELYPGIIGFEHLVQRASAQMNDIFYAEVFHEGSDLLEKLKELKMKQRSSGKSLNAKIQTIEEQLELIKAHAPVGLLKKEEISKWKEQISEDWEKAKSLPPKIKQLKMDRKAKLAEMEELVKHL